MSFLVPCPNCGPRRVDEFSFGGEYQARPVPTPNLTDAAWGHYLYGRKNVAGLQTEWWHHRYGCDQWFLAERDTRKNAVHRTYWPPVGTAPVPAQGPKQREPWPAA